jgi:hypothetical protein
MAPSRGGVSGSYLSDPYKITVTYGATGEIQTVNGPLVQPTRGNSNGSGNQGPSWFSPLNPIAPLAPAEVAGRQWDYPAGYNLATSTRPYDQVSFATLRELAYSYDLLRIIIETRKDQIGRVDWNIKPRGKAGKTGVAASGDKRIAELTKFFSRPDGYTDWPDWIRLILEDVFVIDAPSIYCQRTRAGQLVALYPVDGATIKPVIDDWGRRPQPFVEGGVVKYPVAYQQILKGYPAVDYSVRDLIYRPRNPRIGKPYGYSPVEQIITTVNIGLRRELFTLNYFTEGTLPDTIISLPQDWSVDQISTFQRHWDSYFDSELGRRRKVKFTPGSTGQTVNQMKQPELSGQFDEWLAKIVCFAFSVSPQGFVKQMNRSSAETQQEIAEQEGIRPLLRWIKSVVDRILEEEFDAGDLEFVWKPEDSPDEAKQAKILTDYAAKGILTINEVRRHLDKDPFPDSDADRPIVLTSAGYVRLGDTLTTQAADAAAAAAKLAARHGDDDKPGNQPANDGDVGE